MSRSRRDRAAKPSGDAQVSGHYRAIGRLVPRTIGIGADLLDRSPGTPPVAQRHAWLPAPAVPCTWSYRPSTAWSWMARSRSRSRWLGSRQTFGVCASRKYALTQNIGPHMIHHIKKTAGPKPRRRDGSSSWPKSAQELQNALVRLVGERERGDRDRLAGRQRLAVGRFLVGIGQSQVG